MRIRTIFLIVAIVLLALFAFLNVDEFMRPSVLSLGFTTVQVPLGLVMLALLVVAVLVFLATTIYIQSQNLIESRKYARELQSQRELADKAEASRFTELQRYIESENAAAAEKAAQSHAALIARIEQLDNANGAYIGELEDRLERRDGTSAPVYETHTTRPVLDAFGRTRDVPVSPVTPVTPVLVDTNPRRDPLV